LAGLVAVLGGIVLASVAGARRTSSAYERLLEVTDPPELLVSPAGEGTDPTAFYTALASLEGVRGIRSVRVSQSLRRRRSNRQRDPIDVQAGFRLGHSGDIDR